MPKRWRGNTVIEAAIVLPVVLWMGMGLVAYGHYFYAKHGVLAASRDGCRAAIMGTATNSTMNTAISNTLQNLGLNGYTCSTNVYQTSPSGSAISDVSTVTAGTSVCVVLTLTYTCPVSLPTGTPTKTITGITTMVKE